MGEKDLGRSLLNLGATGLSGVPDARQQTWTILDRDRRRVRLLTGLTLGVWLLSTALIWVVLVKFALLFPEMAKLRMDSERGAVTAAQREQIKDNLLLGFQKGTLVIAFSVAVLGLAAFCSVLLNLASRRATLRQINASLVEISGVIEGSPPGGARGADMTPRARREPQERRALSEIASCSGPSPPGDGFPVIKLC